MFAVDFDQDGGAHPDSAASRGPGPDGGRRPTTNEVDGAFDVRQLGPAGLLRDGARGELALHCQVVTVACDEDLLTFVGWVELRSGRLEVWRAETLLQST